MAEKLGFESWLKNKLLFGLFTIGIVGVSYIGYKIYQKFKEKK